MMQARKRRSLTRRIISMVTIVVILLSAVPAFSVSAAQPSDFQSGIIVKFRNAASGKYLNVSRANDADGANVNQFTDDGTPEETFRLRYTASTNTYLIGSMISSNGWNRVVDVQRYGQPIVSGANVQLWDDTDNDSQQFLFQYQGKDSTGYKYCIVPKSQPSVALTAYDLNNGTPTGKSSTSPGNVYVSTKTATPESRQIWYVEEVGESKMILPEDVYYIKNKNSGQYLDVLNGTDANGTNVQQQQLNGSNAQKWRIAYEGLGVYKIYSQVGSGQKVLNIASGDDSLEGNLNIWNNADASGRRFAIALNSDGYSYRMMSQCSDFTRVITVKGATCNREENVFQYQYNGTYNDEWIFEPVFNYSATLAVQYAQANALKTDNTPTYPYLGDMGGDCANFVSQCMLAGGVHFQGEWWIYKKNSTYMRPTSSTQLDTSWSLADPSPWISASQFNTFWSERVTVETYSTDEIAQNPSLVCSRPFYVGDAVQLLSRSFWGTPGSARHTMLITGYGNLQIAGSNQQTYLVSYHSNGNWNMSLWQICVENPNQYIRLFTIN